MTCRETLGEQLGRARRRRFVGRRAELELFAVALSAPEPPFTVLHVHGPGGVGKTALLQGFAELATAAGALAVRLDARHYEPSPAGFMGDLRQALGLPEGGSPIEVLAEREQAVLFVDTYEAAAAVDDWVRDELVPALPAGVLVVLAGREPPTSGWRADPGWGELLRVISLRNLPPEDSRAFLRAAGVPEALHADTLAFSHGHPLALSLLVDVLKQQDSPTAADLAGDTNVVRVLVERFTATVASPRHRLALEACALVRAMTESELRIALDTDDVGELFMWLRSLSFVEDSAHGLTLHDLARDVLDSDLRWRDPSRYEQLRHRLLEYLANQIRDSTGDLQQRLLLDLWFLHRMSPALRGAHDWRRRSLDEWARLMDQRGAYRATVTPEPAAETAVLVLSQPEFAESVRAALRGLSRPALLAGNPLLSSRLVLRAASGAGSPEVLVDVVRAAIEALRGDPRDEKLYRALDRTYLRPAMTQERAAEVLGLPFSTYRRHLSQGVARVISLLWHDEVYPDSPMVEGESSSRWPVD